MPAWETLREQEVTPQIEERELSDRQGEEIARERLTWIRETERQIDTALWNLPDSPERDMLVDAIALQRSQIHETGRDIGNGQAQRNPDELARSILQLPDILRGILEVFRSMFWLWWDQTQWEGEIFHERSPHREASAARESLQDSFLDEQGYIIAENVSSMPWVIEAVIWWENQRFLQDLDQWFLSAQNHGDSSVMQALISSNGRHYVPFDNSHRFFDGDINSLHIEVGGVFFTTLLSAYTPYLSRAHPDLAYMYEQHQSSPRWVAERNMSLIPYFGLCGTAFLDCMDGGGNISYGHLQESLIWLHAAYPNVLSIWSRELLISRISERELWPCAERLW